MRQQRSLRNSGSNILDQPIGEFLIGMEPIKTWKGEPVILTVANGGAGLVLIGRDGSADAEIPVAARFLFVRSNEAALAKAVRGVDETAGPERSPVSEAERVRAVPGLRRQMPKCATERSRQQRKGAAIMGSIPRKPLRVAYHCSLALLGLTCLLRTADARQMLLLSEQFPGPWLEVTQEIRDVLALNKVSACSQAAGRESSRNPGEYLLYCTSDEKLWTSWRVQPAARTVRGPGRLFQGIALPDEY